jgi:hypothetical protein
MYTGYVYYGTNGALGGRRCTCDSERSSRKLGIVSALTHRTSLISVARGVGSDSELLSVDLRLSNVTEFEPTTAQ